MRKPNTKIIINRSMAACGLVLLSSLAFVAPAQAACPAQYEGYGKLSGTFDISTAGTYTAWSRIQPKSAGNDSFILEIDGTSCGVVVGDSATIPSNQWTWVDYRDGASSSKIKPTLAAGTHSYVIYGREDNVGVDKIIFISSTCTPSAAGSNCTAAAGTPPASGGSLGTASSSPVAILTNPVSAVTSAVKNIQTPAQVVGTVADIIAGNKPISAIAQIVTGRDNNSTASTTRLSPTLVKTINIGGITFMGGGLAAVAFYFVQHWRHKKSFAFLHNMGGSHTVASTGAAVPIHPAQIIQPTISSTQGLTK